MSNHIGKKSIKIPNGINITIVQYSTFNTLLISYNGQGDRGIISLSFSYPSYFKLSFNHQILTITTDLDQPNSAALWGSLQSKIESIITGISQGYSRKLSLIGVGFRFQTTDKPNVYLLFIGYTNPITIEIPTIIQCKLINNTTLEGKCYDLQLLTNTFNKIRNLKASHKDKYKGKGISISV